MRRHKGTAGCHSDREKCGEEERNRTLQGARHSFLCVRKPPTETKSESKDLPLRRAEENTFIYDLFYSESLVQKIKHSNFSSNRTCHLKNIKGF